MKHRQTPLFPRAAWALALLAPAIASASPAGDQAACVKRIGEAMQGYSQTFVGALAACHADNLGVSEPVDCREDADVRERLKEGSEKLYSALTKCIPTSLAEVCALGETTPAGVFTALAGLSGALRAPLNEIATGLFETAVPQCPRPTGPVTKAAASCAKTLGSQFPRVLGQLQQCVSKCEASWTKSGGEICIAPDTGEPLRDKVVECVARARERMTETTAKRCTPAALVELGCPLGTASPQDLALAFDATVFAATQGLWSSVYHAPCRTVIAVAPIPTTVEVELDPSGRRETISCGQDLDADFFGDDHGLLLRGDLNCQDMPTATDGLRISRSGVTIDLGKEFRISGPARSDLRTGAAVRVTAPDVRVRRGILQRFGTGLLGTAAALGLEVEQLVVQSNIGDGIRVDGDGADIDSNSVKNNGDDGIVANGPGARLISNTLEKNGGDGIVVTGANAVIDGNQLGSLKDDGNGGWGMLVTGELADVYSNTAEANLAGGYRIRSATVRFKSNDATSNRGTGFSIDSAGSLLDSNRADFNEGFEFDIAPGNIDLSGNRANGSMIEFPIDGGAFD